MNHPLLGKLLALGGVMLALVLGLNLVGDIVEERQDRQHEAEQSVANAFAGSQTIVGPVLQRRCQETWTRVDPRPGEGRREFVQTLWPKNLSIGTSARIEQRHRGLFTVNGYIADATLDAEWPSTALPAPTVRVADARVSCEAATVSVAVADARGIRAATVAGRTVLPGSLLTEQPKGLHVVVPDTDALRLTIALTLAGTGSLQWAPVAEQTTVQATSNWPHPSFDGRFLPVSYDVTPQGFRATWQVSALAADAGTDTFGVRFIDPVDGYVLSDRAIKYGLLFIALTFVGVAMLEIVRQLRVHPVQYLLVGAALTVFFLLLASLSEHIGFDAAYLCASAACTALLAFYGTHVLGGLRRGLAFGAAIALLYGALYALLQLEQTALVLGSLLLFAVLAAVMVVTRRTDWYALAARVGATGQPAA